jgi:cellulose synthase/poly-beta-1,6-N-acetylglucosamine synthase-like glycosyltransferase
MAVHDAFPGAEVAVTGAEVLPGAARNVLLERARGEWLVFLDDDVTVRPDFLRRLADLAAAHPGVGVLGGPNETPTRSTRFQVTQGAVLASSLGGGPVRGRYGARAAGPADETSLTLCNLAVRRAAMQPFSVDLTCAEENEVLDKLRRQGLAMWYDPGLVAFHERRGTLTAFARQIHKYGRGRGELTVRRPTSLRPVLLAPAAFVAYLLCAVLLAVTAHPLALAPLGAYLCMVTAASIVTAARIGDPTAAPQAAVLFALLHACYGAGVWRGLMPARSRSAPHSVWLVPQPSAFAAA